MARPLLGGIVAVVVLVLACGDDADGGDATVLKLDPANGDVTWSRDLAGWTVDPPSPAGEVMLVQGHRTLYAFDAESGTELWKRDGTYASSLHPLPVIDGVALLQSEAADEARNEAPLIALDPATGEERWRAGCIVGGYAGRVLDAGDGRAFLAASCQQAGSFSTELIAFDVATGEELWRTGDIQYRPPGDAFAVGLGSAPAYAAGMVVYGNFDGMVWARDAATGEVAWSAAIETPPKDPTVSVSGETVFVRPSHGETLIAFDIATGVERWRVPINAGPWGRGESVTYNEPLVVGSGVVFFVPGTLIAFDVETGEQHWTLPAKAGPLATDGSTLYLGGEASLAAIDPSSGSVLWEREYDLDGLVQPVTVAGGLYATAFGEPPPYRD